MNPARPMLTTLILAAGALIAWNGAPTTACPSECDGGSGEVKEIRSVELAPPAPAATAVRFLNAGNGVTTNNETVVVVSGGDQKHERTLKIVEKNGRYVVYVNGEKVASGEGGNMDALLDKFINEDEVNRFHFRGDDKAKAVEGLATMQWVGADEGDQALQMLKLGDGQDVVIERQAVERPRVMVGVMMEDVDENLANYLGIDPAKATRITRVIEGLPAAESGLRTQDIIIRIDGSDAAAPDDIRAVLGRKAPGDRVQVKVLRAGQPQEITVRLKAYDAGALGMSEVTASQAPTADSRGNPFFDVTAEVEGGYDAVIEDLMRTMRQHLGNNEEALEELESHLEGLRVEIQDQFGNRLLRGWSTAAPPSWNVPTIPDEALQKGMYRFYLGDGEEGAVIVPRFPTAPASPSVPAAIGQPGRGLSDDLDARMDQLDQRLDRLESLLERLLEKSESTR